MQKFNEVIPVVTCMMFFLCVMKVKFNKFINSLANNTRNKKKSFHINYYQRQNYTTDLSPNMYCAFYKWL